MSHLGPNELRFVEALRAHDEPSDEDRVRVRAAILAKIAAAGAGATALTGAADAAASSPVASAAGLSAGHSATLGAAAAASGSAGLFGGALGLKLGLATIGIASAGIALVWGLSSAPVPPDAATVTEAAPMANPQHIEAPQVARPVDPDLIPVLPSALPLESEPRAGSPSAALARSQPAPASAGASSLDAELALIAAAQKAMQQGAPAGALTLLDQHAAEFPRGVLSLERSGLRVVALCQAGRLAEGRSLAEAFLAGNPKSPLSSRIRASCQL